MVILPVSLKLGILWTPSHVFAWVNWSTQCLFSIQINKKSPFEDASGNCRPQNSGHGPLGPLGPWDDATNPIIHFAS